MANNSVTRLFVRITMIKSISCFEQNEGYLADSSGFSSEAALATFLEDELGLVITGEPSTNPARHLETDDYYLQALTEAKVIDVQVFTCRAVTDNYCKSFHCPSGQGFSSTYHKICLTQSAILTGSEMIIRLGQHTPIPRPVPNNKKNEKIQSQTLWTFHASVLNKKNPVFQTK